MSVWVECGALWDFGIGGVVMYHARQGAKLNRRRWG